MTKKTVTLTYTIEVEYDETSEAFENAYSDYTESIDGSADIEDFVQNVVYQAHRGGAHRMIEGAGYVKCGGALEDKEMYCGIDIDDDDPIPDIQMD
jgi:hypothetical protein